MDGILNRQSIERQKAKALALVKVLRESLKATPTPREEEVLRFVHKARKISGRSPSQVTVAKHFKFTRERARQLMGRLKDKGFLIEDGRSNGKSRTTK